MDCRRDITFIAYDTLCRICISDPVKNVRELLEQAKALALSVQYTLNMYDSDSELSRLCSSYIPGRPEKISKMLFDFICLNLEFSQQTEGNFDFTVGTLVKMWNFLSDQPEIPDKKKIGCIRKSVGYHKVHLKQEREVVFDTEGMILDPGASGKGYALGLTVDFLKNHGILHAVLDFGGNVFVIGGKKDLEEKEKPWRVAIRHPNSHGNLGVVELMNRGIATSSWYEHGFEKNGRIYHHLLNPYTGEPQESDISSVSIISSYAIYTDFVSTAFFIMGMEKGCRLMKYLKHCKNIDVDYIAIKKNGELSTSDGIKFIANC